MLQLKYLIDKKNWVKLFRVYKLNGKNLDIETHYSQNVRKIYGFYHVYCLCENWQKLVEEQIAHLRASGLYDQIEKLHCSVIGYEQDVEEFKMLAGEKCSVDFTSSDPTFFEYPILIKLHEICCKEEPFIGFYFHTKGVTWLSTPTVYKVGNSWRLMAEYWMFDRWKLAISAILSGAYVYGTNYQEIFNDEYRLIGGNFWWFDSKYVKTLHRLDVDHINRTPTETWILSNTHNVYCPFTFYGSTRYDMVPVALYCPEILFLNRFVTSCASYFKRYRYLIKRITGRKVIQINPVWSKVTQQ